MAADGLTFSWLTEAAQRDVSNIASAADSPPNVPWDGGARPDGSQLRAYASLLSAPFAMKNNRGEPVVAVKCKGITSTTTGKPCHETSFITYKSGINASNIMAHFRAAHKSMLWQQDIMPTADDIGSAAAIAADEAAGAAVAKRKTIAREDRRQFVSLLVGACGLPESLCEKPGWRIFSNLHGISTFSRSSVARTFKEMKATLIDAPRDEFIARALAPQTYVFKGQSLQLNGLVFVSFDGWKILAMRHQYISHVLHSYEILNFGGIGVPELRPTNRVVALNHMPLRLAGDLPKGAAKGAAAAAAAADDDDRDGYLEVDGEGGGGIRRPVARASAGAKLPFTARHSSDGVSRSPARLK